MQHDDGMHSPPRPESGADPLDDTPERASPIPEPHLPVAVWLAAPDGRFVEPQADWERYTGQGWQAHRDHGWLDVIHPDDRERVGEELRPDRRGVETVAFEGRIRRPDKGGFRRFIARALPVRGPDGELLAWSGTVVDVEETWAPHRRLRELGAQLRGILDYSPAVVFIKDLEGHYVVASRSCAAVMGIQPEALVGRTDEQVWPEVAADLRENDRRVAEDGAVVEAEELVSTPEGERLFHSTKFPLRDADGHVSGVAGIATDVTDRRRALEQVRVEVERRDQFIAMLSHELRNPVHAAQGALAVARQGEGVGAEPLDVIERQLTYLASILEDLLEVSRVTQGKISMRFETIDLREAAWHGIEMTAQLAARNGVKVDELLPDEPMYVRADLARVAQIVGNLLNNAIRFSSPGQTVTVRVFRRASRHWVEVSDRGLGLSEDDHRGMFELFYQGESSLDRSRGGLGVGLTLVKTLASQHGADIEVNGAPGEGATFRVGFDQAEPELQPAAPPTRREKSRPLRLLLVEDNEDARMMLRLALRRRGHVVSEAATGEEGLRAAAEWRPDVAIVDIGLPGLDGYEVARRLRAAEDTRDLTIVALTGYGRPEDRRAALEAGFDAHLTKPLAPRDLDRVLREIGSAHGR